MAGWYAAALGTSRVGMHVKMHKAVLSVLTPASAEDRRRSERRDRYADPRWEGLYREFPRSSLLPVDEERLLVSVMDEIGPVVAVEAASSKGAHLESAWHRLEVDPSVELTTTKEAWRTRYDTRLGNEVGRAILDTIEITPIEPVDVVGLAVAEAFDWLADEVTNVASELGWLFAVSADRGSAGGVGRPARCR